MNPKEKLAQLVDKLNKADGLLAEAQLLSHELSTDSRGMLIRTRHVLGEYIQLIKLSLAA